MNYDAAAKRLANEVHARRGDDHRGACWLQPGETAAAFGNDDYGSFAATRALVGHLFRFAHDSGCAVLGFATDDEEGSAWALVLHCDRLDWLKARLHDAYYLAHPALFPAPPEEAGLAVAAGATHAIL